MGTLARTVLEAIREQAPEGAAGATRRSDGAAAEATGTPEGALQTVDAEVDRAMFAELAKLARASKSTFLRELAALQIDIANVKSLLRARLAGTPSEDVLELVLKGGSISRKRLAALYQMPPAEVGAHLASLPLLSGIPAADLADLSRLDVIADNVVVEYLRRARLVPFGAEPVIAYVMGREAEVRAVRTLLIGKLAGLPTEVLRRRLRNLYV